MFPATLFDFNGVLADDEHVHLEAFQDTLRPLGIELTERAYWDHYLGYDDVGAFEAILRDHGREPTPSTVRQLVADKRPHYMTRARAGLRTFPGAAELIRARAAVGPVAVVSGALTDEIEFGLTHLGVRDLVGHIVSAEDTTVSKPDPEGYRMGMEWLRPRVGEGAARAIVFEDSPAGIQAAKALGLPVVALAHSYGEAELLSAGADLVLERLELVDVAQLEALYARLYG
ncbi:MAG TPA: HAD family phosphatase [Polyangiaceae bacterium]|nr:HAD family phosphatase [Polyangiaceae bacterium]